MCSCCGPSNGTSASSTKPERSHVRHLDAPRHSGNLRNRILRHHNQRTSVHDPSGAIEPWHNRTHDGAIIQQSCSGKNPHNESASLGATRLEPAASCAQSGEGRSPKTSEPTVLGGSYRLPELSHVFSSISVIRTPLRYQGIKSVGPGSLPQRATCRTAELYRVQVARAVHSRIPWRPYRRSSA